MMTIQRDLEKSRPFNLVNHMQSINREAYKAKHCFKNMFKSFLLIFSLYS